MGEGEEYVDSVCKQRNPFRWEILSRINMKAPEFTAMDRAFNDFVDEELMEFCDSDKIGLEYLLHREVFVDDFALHDEVDRVGQTDARSVLQHTWLKMLK